MAGNITFSNRLKELKGETSGRKFAEKCGISHAVMGKYLNGTTSPTLDSLIKISQATNVNIDWLSGAGNVSFENARFLGASDFETIPYIRRRLVLVVVVFSMTTPLLVSI